MSSKFKVGDHVKIFKMPSYQMFPNESSYIRQLEISNFCGTIKRIDEYDDYCSHYRYHISLDVLNVCFKFVEYEISYVISDNIKNNFVVGQEVIIRDIGDKYRFGCYPEMLDDLKRSCFRGIVQSIKGDYVGILNINVKLFCSNYSYDFANDELISVPYDQIDSNCEYPVAIDRNCRSIVVDNYPKRDIDNTVKLVNNKFDYDIFVATRNLFKKKEV